MRWINSQLASAKKSINPKNQLSLFNEIKHLIRFPLMSEGQFDLGPGRSKLFSQSELDEFKMYFATKNKKVLTTNYSLNERNALQIHKLRFNEDKKRTFVQLDKHADSEKDHIEVQIDPECEVINLDERDKEMAKQFGKNYAKDGTKRKKAATKASPVDKKKKVKTEEPQIERIHLFKFQLIFKDKKQFDEYWNDELVPEVHVEGVQQNIQFSRYIKAGSAYIALDRPVAIASGSEFRIAFRTRSNKCLHNSFRIADVLTMDEDESRVEVKLSVLDKELRMANMTDIFFVYKEDYVEQPSFTEVNSKAAACQSEESSHNSTMESYTESKENLDLN